MLLSDVQDQLPKEVMESAAARGMSKLTPPQESAVKQGLLQGGNFVIASPTASGKTFIAEMAMLKAVLHRFKKAVYVAPMRALVSEKYEELKEAYPFLRVAISIGDLDSLDLWLSRYDVIFVSTEKLDSLIRHGVDWLDSLGAIIFDEVHMIDDPGRGPTLDILVTKLRTMCKNAQIIALSATVGNAHELAQWLDAKLVESEYRPVKLEKGVAFDGKAYYINSDEGDPLYGGSSVPEIRIAEDTLHRKKQMLSFYGTKRNAEAGAEKISQVIENALTLSDKQKLHEVSEEILHALSKPTAQCEKLARLVDKGAAFHHSGLVNAQRHAVENAFRDNVLKVICATPTLCLPAGEEVMCNFEPKQIQELTSGVKVLTHRGVFKKVITPMRRTYSGELLEIKALGQLPARMTPEHRILISKRRRHSIHSDKQNRHWYIYSEPEWIEAKHLEKGDLVLYPRIKENKTPLKITLKPKGPLANQYGIVGKHWSRLAVDSIDLDGKNLEALGLFIAEGYTGKNGIVRFAINTNEQILTDRITDWFKSLGLHPTINDFERHRRTINACSKQLAETLRELFGTEAKNKRIPQDFLLMSEKALTALVKGMWSGDGCLCAKNKTYGWASYSTASKVLAKQLFTALVKLGYMPCISYSKSKISTSRKERSVNIDKHGDIYQVKLSGKQLLRFANDVLNKDLTFRGNRTYNFGKIDNDYYYMPVARIEKVQYSGTVYNLEVEGDASYVGSFIVHNSLGVNLPAHTVLVRDTSRYSEAEGAEKLGVNEVTQLFGRAGRPKYDTEGRALVIARSRSEVTDLAERYITAPLEPVTSKLGVLPVLRTHVLAFIATNMLRTRDSIAGFLAQTFYGYQFAGSRELNEITSAILAELTEWDFIRKSESVYLATKVGQRVSELYIDPLSAKWMIDVLPRTVDDVARLFMISNTVEMRPYVKATEEAEAMIFDYGHMLASKSVNFEADLSYYDPVKPFGTALMLRDWANEVPERDMVKKYGTTPGSLYTKITNADWLLYSSIELAKLVKVSTVKLHELRVRVKYGIRPELLDLVRLEQVGRVRARMMHSNGIASVADLRLPGAAERVTKLFGKEISKRIMDQVATGSTPSKFGLPE